MTDHTKAAPSAQQAAGSIDTLSDHKCGACNGSGWMVRDEDIGTDQECFSCDGSGRVEDDAPISAAAERGVDYIMAAVQSFADEWRRERGNFGIRVEALNTKARIRRMLEEDAAKLAATPAQPIAPEKLTADLIHLLNTIRPNFGDVGTRDVDVAQQRQRIDRAIIQLGLIVAHDGREHPTPRPGAQPIAVSAPTDAPLSKDALELLNNLHGKASIPTDWPQPFAGTIVLLETLAEIGMTAKRDGQPTANSRLCVRFAADLRDFLAARAAAPVSGPTCKACNGAGTWIGQHDGYDDADCAVCDGSGKAAPVSGPTEDTLTKLHNRVKEMQEAAYTFGEYSKEAVSAALDGVLDEIAAISAAPVSGQGASIGDDGQFLHRLQTWRIAISDGAKQSALIDLIAYIESRPRSEDSRADTLEEAAEACENLVESIGDAAAYDQREMYDTELERMHTAMACAAAIRALASTTPQKADDE